MCAAMSQAAAMMQTMRQLSLDDEQEKLLPLFNGFLNSVTLSERPRGYAMQEKVPAAISSELIKVLLSGQFYSLSGLKSGLTSIERLILNFFNQSLTDQVSSQQLWL